MSESNQFPKLVSKIRVKLGDIEIDFEGTEEYIRSDLPGLLELICNYSSLAKDSSESDVDIEESEELIVEPNPNRQRVQMTTNTIAAKLNVKTGSDLVMAACAHLCLVKGADTFERKNILAEMKTASNYFKQTHSKNLSQSLSSLIKDNKLIERSKDKYALTAETKRGMEEALA